jgi:trigger factor
LALVEGCKHALEISVPVEEVEKETERVVASLARKARLPGFRPGKVPASLIRGRFQREIRQDVLESLVPKYFQRRIEQDNLRVVGTPDITEVHFDKGEPLRFKAEFETAPEVELKEYLGVTVTYSEPTVTEEDIDARIEELRQQKAEYVNVDPRPVADGDFAVVSLTSLSGVEGEPISQDELMLHVGDEETLAGFSENLRDMVPGEEKDFDVTYPENYGQERLSGKTVRFHVSLKAIRSRELPDLNDEFAQDLGDYKNLDELREAVRMALRGEREFQAQQDAKNELVDKLIDLHEFPVPEAFLERQIEINIEQRLRDLAAQGVDPRSLNLDWDQVKQAQRARALREVKASLVLERIADREAIEPTMEEVDREVHRIARQAREPVAAVRMRLEKEGVIRRIASRIRTDKTLNFLFDHARKVAPETKEPEEPEGAD